MSKTTSLDIDGMSAEEKIEQIKMMRDLIRLKEKSGDGCSSAFQKIGKKKNLISDTVMSAVFVTSFVLIVAMALYSFRTLYLAIQKKFPSQHTEL
ncbi:uncharacterized protein LOC113551416 [Rhopalosiphum maidis]|uniref:uncharacterized protein LOC113551416 n=1 Tax=Rhopalosiphum maidis TaxID=43146 RepID=UPI000DC141D0|nr:uncharacterized protein LOC112594129 isoform X2 [Melanaphis sacchari]XP_026809456.1 uncharacterized protein LOC113551416 [Rhopalosiphum maidis]XP_060834399.1 uncharacterized protein LOC132917602 [Rhopalosiphum padi]